MDVSDRNTTQPNKLAWSLAAVFFFASILFAILYFTKDADQQNLQSNLTEEGQSINDEQVNGLNDDSSKVTESSEEIVEYTCSLEEEAYQSSVQADFKAKLIANEELSRQRSFYAANEAENIFVDDYCVLDNRILASVTMTKDTPAFESNKFLVGFNNDQLELFRIIYCEPIGDSSAPYQIISATSGQVEMDCQGGDGSPPQFQNQRIVYEFEKETTAYHPEEIKQVE